MFYSYIYDCCLSNVNYCHLFHWNLNLDVGSEQVIVYYTSHIEFTKIKVILNAIHRNKDFKLERRGAGRKGFHSQLKAVIN